MRSYCHMPEFVVFLEMKMPLYSMLSVQNVSQYMSMMTVFKLFVETKKVKFAVMFHS